MAKTTLTIRNLNTLYDHSFTFEPDNFDWNMEQIKAKYEASLEGDDWEVVDVDFESDLVDVIHHHLYDYILKHFTFENAEEMFSKIDSLEYEADNISNTVYLWNEYCDAQQYYDDQIYSFDEEFVDMVCTDKMDAIYRCIFGDVNVNHDWAKLNGYANIVTTNYPIHDWMDIDDLVNWYIEER